MKSNVNTAPGRTTAIQSRQVSNNTCGASPFEINNRAVLAMREIGKGLTALEKLCGYMNLLPPMNCNAYNKMQTTLHAAYKNIAEQSMNQASAELRQVDRDDVALNENGVADISVSCDGTWQKRGYSSLNGVVTVISADTCKCLDARVMSKVCHECTYWEKLKGTDKYFEFIEKHICSINPVQQEQRSQPV